MTSERPLAEGPVPGQRPPAGSDDPISIQILATEHWSLLATRSLTWNEAFARTGMFFTVLSASVVALALIAQATAFGDEFTTFAAVLLPVVLFVGVTTYARIVATNNEDALWVIGMNRLRAGYLQRRPDLAQYFISGHTDDIDGIGQTLGGQPGEVLKPLALVLHGFVTTPATVGVVTSVIAGVLAGIVASWLEAMLWVIVTAVVVVFLLTFFLLLLYQFRAYMRAIANHVPRFPPSPP